jgi:hypothetical protein
MTCCKPVPIDYPAVEKTAGAVLNYGFNLAPPNPQQTNVFAPPQPVLVPWLAPGEEVLGLEVSFDQGTPVGATPLQLVDTQITTNATGVPNSLITAWLSGGTVGSVYVVTYTWTTNSQPVQRVDQRSLQVTIVGAR